MKTEYRFIRFEKSIFKKRVWFCYPNLSVESPKVLGFVAFDKGADQYCFSSIDTGPFSQDCLADIQRFMSQLNH